MIRAKPKVTAKPLGVKRLQPYRTQPQQPIQRRMIQRPVQPQDYALSVFLGEEGTRLMNYLC
ncbi:MAG: hypothetical protein NUV46_00570 [Nanoarchaeota archaeon]|nr:hypothetical protein [Nanoarchaeota archaeon]